MFDCAQIAPQLRLHWERTLMHNCDRNERTTRSKRGRRKLRRKCAQLWRSLSVIEHMGFAISSYFPVHSTQNQLNRNKNAGPVLFSSIFYCRHFVSSTFFLFSTFCFLTFWLSTNWFRPFSYFPTLSIVAAMWNKNGDLHWRAKSTAKWSNERYLCIFRIVDSS